MSHPFEVGKAYRNRLGEYIVLSIDGERMVIRYEDGRTLATDVNMQARIWENIQFEQQAAQVEERQRQAQEARMAARQRTARAKQAAPKPAFGGFVESDLEPKQRGIAWSSRQDLGKVLAYELNQGGKDSFVPWIVPRRSEIHIARAGHYDRNALDQNAAFFVVASEKGVSYGFRVGKPEGKVKANWPWSACLAALAEDEELRTQIRTIMEAHKLSLNVYAMQASYGRVGRITVQGYGFLWQHETAEQKISRQIDWSQVLEFLQTVAPAKRCNLYLRKHVSVDTALQAGAGIASEIAAVFEALVSLYDACAAR